MYTNQTGINLRGIAMGNPYRDFETSHVGAVDYYWTHALIPHELYIDILSSCNFSSPKTLSDECLDLIFHKTEKAIGNIDFYNIYAPRCHPELNTSLIQEFDPCSSYHVRSYLNTPDVQRSLHTNVTALPFPWEPCSDLISWLWNDKALTVLPIIRELMNAGLRVWIYSGDVDSEILVTSTRYSRRKLGATVRTPWYPWYDALGEVAGYSIGYNNNLTFATVRGAGHMVPSYQPARALVLFSSFVNGKLPPTF